MKNSYFNIGGYELSLYEIENVILKSNRGIKGVYGESCIFSDDDYRKKLIIHKELRLVDYGISIPTR